MNVAGIAASIPDGKRSPPCPCISALPADVLHHGVFTCLAPRDLGRSASPVCRAWRDGVEGANESRLHYDLATTAPGLRVPMLSPSQQLNYGALCEARSAIGCMMMTAQQRARVFEAYLAQPSEGWQALTAEARVRIKQAFADNMVSTLDVRGDEHLRHVSTARHLLPELFLFDGLVRLVDDNGDAPTREAPLRLLGAFIRRHYPRCYVDIRSPWMSAASLLAFPLAGGAMGGVVGGVLTACGLGASACALSLCYGSLPVLAALSLAAELTGAAAGGALPLLFSLRLHGRGVFHRGLLSRIRAHPSFDSPSHIDEQHMERIMSALLRKGILRADRTIVPERIPRLGASPAEYGLADDEYVAEDMRILHATLVVIASEHAQTRPPYGACRPPLGD